MSVSTDGQICYGIVFEEGFEFPWNTAGQELDDWWRDQTGYKPDRPLYNARGERLPGVSGADLDTYFEKQYAWDKANPCSVQEVNYCSDDCPMYILAIPSTVKIARRGLPQVIVRHLDLEFEPGEREAFLSFIQKYDIKCKSLPAWYLSGFWG